MKYLIIIFLIAASIYPFSYAKYVWSKKNYFGAIGVIFISLAAIIFPSIMILLR